MCETQVYGSVVFVSSSATCSYGSSGGVFGTFYSSCIKTQGLKLVFPETHPSDLTEVVQQSLRTTRDRDR